MTLIEQITADREAGTPEGWFSITDDQGFSNTGPYVVVHQEGTNRSICHVLCVDKCGRHFDMPYEANARRIARVPQMEDALIAAVEALTEIATMLDGEPDYHEQGMGCGLEDRNITDRYEAMSFGWEQAIDRVYGEHINDALELVKKAMEPSQ